MKKITTLLFLVFFTINFGYSQCRQLKVSLYPFIPNPDAFYRIIESKFKAAYPDIDLTITTNPNYYDKVGGILDEAADVYEIDCIFLQDFINKHKIQPLTIRINSDDLMPVTKVVYQNNSLYAVPHWICGNFLFYKNNDPQLKKVKSLKDLEDAIGKNALLDRSLIIELKGKLTLGELYADALLDEYKNPDEVKKHCTVQTIDNVAIQNMRRLLTITHVDWARSSDYHNKISFFPKEFAKNHGRAFVGYSESLYNILYEINNDCSKEENCISANDINISEWVLSDNGSMSMGWVDALGINANLSGQKLTDATNFINFLVSQASYYSALIPEFETPRYLLPAYKQYYTDTTVIHAAPLYSQLFPLALKLNTFISENISFNLSDIGKQIDVNLLK